MNIQTKLHICPDVNCNEIAVALEVYVDGKQAWFGPQGGCFWTAQSVDGSHEQVPAEIVKAVLERPEECWKPGLFKRVEQPSTEVTKDASV